jgi:putative ATPase
VDLAGGDARQALNVLEGAVALAEDEDHRDADRVSPTLVDVEAAAQQRVLAYDRAGDGHYDTVSAFIKSLRGNDPDAALYWLAAMITAGEDPKFIVRRLIISASEDIGNADPRALQVAVAAAQALDYVGLPEAQYALAQATIYLAVAPKSNRSGTAYGAAMADVTGRGSLPVPNHLRNAGDRRMKHHGIGVGYLYPHEYEGSDVKQQYLPDELADHRYFHPSAEGSERRIGELMEERRARREAGRPKRLPQPPGSGMSGIGDGMKANMEARKRLAQTQKRDAAE